MPKPLKLLTLVRFSAGARSELTLLNVLTAPQYAEPATWTRGPAGGSWTGGHVSPVVAILFSGRRRVVLVTSDHCLEHLAWSSSPSVLSTALGPKAIPYTLKPARPYQRALPCRSLAIQDQGPSDQPRAEEGTNPLRGAGSRSGVGASSGAGASGAGEARGGDGETDEVVAAGVEGGGFLGVGPWCFAVSGDDRSLLLSVGYWDHALKVGHSSVHRWCTAGATRQPLSAPNEARWHPIISS